MSIFVRKAAASIIASMLTSALFLQIPGISLSIAKAEKTFVVGARAHAYVHLNC